MTNADLRNQAKKRPISAGTRSDPGRRSWDTFASLKKTCRKLGVSFWSFLVDRVSGTHTFPGCRRSFRLVPPRHNVPDLLICYPQDVSTCRFFGPGHPRRLASGFPAGTTGVLTGAERLSQ
ncbi:MAG: hypothetical protein ACFCVA_11395 [Gammaproteobacteria bacterium]